MILLFCLFSVLFITFQYTVSVYSDKSFKQHRNFNGINHIKYHLYAYSSRKLPIWESYDKYCINNIIDSSGHVTASMNMDRSLNKRAGMSGLNYSLIERSREGVTLGFHFAKKYEPVPTAMSSFCSLCSSILVTAILLPVLKT
jgi:hypothetical protein